MNASLLSDTLIGRDEDERPMLDRCLDVHVDRTVSRQIVSVNHNIGVPSGTLWREAVQIVRISCVALQLVASDKIPPGASATLVDRVFLVSYAHLLALYFAVDISLHPAAPLLVGVDAAVLVLVPLYQLLQMRLFAGRRLRPTPSADRVTALHGMAR